MLIQLLKAIFGKEDNETIPSFKEKTIETSNHAPSVIPTAEASILNAKEEVKEVAFFTRKNSLAEVYLDEPPSIINRDGTVYFGPNDPRNTYDPRAPKWVEDYDGSWYNVGGDPNKPSTTTPAVVSKRADEIKVEILPGDDMVTREIKKAWIESQKNTANYGGVFSPSAKLPVSLQSTQLTTKPKEAEVKSEEVYKPEYKFDKNCFLGLDPGGYDGNTFCWVVYQEGQVIEQGVVHDVDEFNSHVEAVTKKYNIDEAHTYSEPTISKPSK